MVLCTSTDGRAGEVRCELPRRFQDRTGIDLAKLSMLGVAKEGEEAMAEVLRIDDGDIPTLTMRILNARVFVAV